jgi:hypothetical protein
MCSTSGTNCRQREREREREYRHRFLDRLGSMLIYFTARDAVQEEFNAQQWIIHNLEVNQQPSQLQTHSER